MDSAGDWCLQRVGFHETVHHLPQEGQVLIKRYQPNKKSKNPSEVSFFLNSPRVSRQHGKLVFQNNSWHILDCESSNGVFINNTRISANELKPLAEGDVIGFGGPDARESHFYVYTLCRKMSLQTAGMGEEAQGDSHSLTQLTLFDPVKSEVQLSTDSLDETQPNLSIVDQLEAEIPDVDATMPLLMEQRDSEYDSDIVILETDMVQSSNSNLAISSHTLETFRSPPNVENRVTPTEQRFVTYSGPPLLKIFGTASPITTEAKVSQDLNSALVPAEKGRGGGRIRGRARGKRNSRWSSINISTNRTKRNPRVTSETAPSIWNIGTRVTRNAAAKLQSRPLTSTPSQSNPDALCNAEPNSGMKMSISPISSMVGYLQPSSPITSFMHGLNHAMIETDNSPVEDGSSCQVSRLLEPRVWYPAVPVDDLQPPEPEMISLKHRLVTEVCATFQEILNAGPLTLNRSLERLTFLKKNLSKFRNDLDLELNEQIHVTLSSNQSSSSLSLANQYQIVLPVSPQPCPVKLLNSLTQSEPILLGPGALLEGHGSRLTSEQQAAIKEAQCYALKISVELVILKELSEQYAS